jgi:Putative bacterial sensory transduction regulator
MARVPGSIMPYAVITKDDEMKRWTTLTAVGLLVALAQVPGWAQTQTAKAVSPEQLKKMLDSLGRKYTANAEGDFHLNVAKPGADKVDYRCFLYSFEKGRAVVITCNGLMRGGEPVRLKAVPASDQPAVDELLERINQWNVNRSLSRAILSKGADTTGKKICYARLESDIDWELGVTDKKVDALINQFAKSLVDFESFLGEAK